MKLNLACADFTFPLLPHEKVLDLIALLGFEGVDIGLFEKRSHLQPSQEFRNIGRSARNLARRLGDRGLRPADVFLQVDGSFVTFASNHPEARKRRKARDWFEKTIEYATGCGARHVTGLPGADFNGVPHAESFRRCCEELAWRVEKARDARITFSVEAHIGSVVPKPRDAQRLVRSVPGLTLTLDYTHFAYLGLPDSAVEPLVAHASHFHARGGRRGRLQCSFKDNTIDYRRILRVMDRTGYPGYIGVEYVWTEWQRCNEVDNLSETVLFRDFFRKHFNPILRRTRA
ncbi:MAG: sugar phosphate isomerase/epimerase [Planctomycetes bacterium]|nr:sugar phosphate isomerase/epimerase [Planctomycetota bacterium]